MSFKRKIWYPIRSWVGKNILHLDHTKGFQIDDYVYTWDDERNCVDYGKIVYIETYYDRFTGAKEDYVEYLSDFLHRSSSDDSGFYRTEEECRINNVQ